MLGELANRMANIRGSELIKALMKMGMMVTIKLSMVIQQSYYVQNLAISLKGLQILILKLVLQMRKIDLKIWSLERQWITIIGPR